MPAKNTTSALRVFVVEDEMMLAFLFETMLADLGHSVVGPAARLEKGLEIAEKEAIDLAVLDVNLDGREVYPIAAALDLRGIPFIFATGYGTPGLHPAYRDRPVLEKPYRLEDLRAAIAGVFDRSQAAQKQAVRASEVPKKQIIVPIGRDAEWLEARELVSDKGGLPSHVLHDETLVNSDDWVQLQNQKYYGAYGAWAREVIVYPEVNGRFVKGRDVEDAFTDDAGRRWIFPASSIPDIAINGEKTALFINPQDVEHDDKKVVILSSPETIIVLTEFIQKDGWGKVDQTTRIPLETDLNLVPASQQRHLSRISGQGVRPLARTVNDFGVYGRDVYALRRPVLRLGVAGVELATRLSQPVFARVVTPKVIAPLLKDAKTNHEKLLSSGTLNRDELKPYEKLFRALEIKEY
jgi:CheY-like chemotaxis protein